MRTVEYHLATNVSVFSECAKLLFVNASRPYMSDESETNGQRIHAVQGAANQLLGGLRATFAARKLQTRKHENIENKQKTCVTEQSTMVNCHYIYMLIL